MTRAQMSFTRRIAAVALFVLLGSVLTPLAALAHVERPSYWPNPKPDCTIAPCAGGKVPHARSLASSLDRKKVGDTRVVCKPSSMRTLRASIRHARAQGYYVRPTVHRSLSAHRAHALLRINRQLFQRCAYHQIQRAVTASHNNDRVVVMPGVYKERHSRKQPTNDPACKNLTTTSDRGDPGALTHDYQLKCPNDANLVAVIGRGKDTAPLPAQPRKDRHGIPNVGKCIRCNMQLEGSGVSADDVVVEAGKASAGNGGPSAVGHKKDVGIFVDRADGFVLRNLTVRHAREHDIYVLETDGYLLDHFKTFYAGGYGVLTFVEDHGVIQNCEAAGNGDSGLYPGSGADSTDHRYKKFYPKYRFSQVLRRCDSHHNTGGFSGTDSHGTLIAHNNFYDNALGLTTDVFTASGHPGFPQHGNVIRHNNFYSNNFNPYQQDSDVEPFIPAPVGTGLWFAGGNANEVDSNRFYDNWRRGVMVFAVPDATVCGPSDPQVPGCDATSTSTSYDNQIHDNTMGVSPAGEALPNGLDFWWDSFPGNTGNCWWGNTAAPGQSITSAPPALPNCADGTDPSTSIGTSYPPNESELVACFAGLQASGYPDGDPTTCDWTQTPAKPGSQAAAATGTGAMQGYQAQEFSAICAAGLSPRLCGPFSELMSLLPSWSSPLPPAATGSAPTAAPKYSAGRLGTFTCSWWRKADEAHRRGMVQRIQNFASGPVYSGDGATAYGHGAKMSEARTTRLFDDRCSTFQAGGFALYKLYGAAAPFSALAGGS
jgi:hypothetical protein